MASKILTGTVIAFWAVMMTALVRVEFYPRESRLVPVTPNRVLSKIFQNSQPADLNVIYQNGIIGTLRANVTPVTSAVTEPIKDSPSKIGAYDVHTDLWLNLVIFGAPSRMHILGKALFDPHYAMKKFDIISKMGESQASIHADNESRKLNVSYNLGEGPQSRDLNYADLTGPNVFNALGLTGLPGLPALSSFGMLGSAPSDAATKTTASRVIVRAYDDSIPIGAVDQRVYLLEIKLDQALPLWAKIWVDLEGNILIVDSSAGLSMRSTKLSSVTGHELVDRTFERAARKPHDPN